MDPRDAMEPDQLETLNRVFSEQLLACLDECARGRRGLFSEFVGEDGENAGWPEAARLRELAVALQGSSRSRKSATRYATSSSICARFTARAIPANASWRAHFLSASSAAKWEHPHRNKDRHGNRVARSPQP